MKRLHGVSAVAQQVIVLIVVAAALLQASVPLVASGQPEAARDNNVWSSDNEDSWHYWWSYQGISGPEVWGTKGNPDWSICDRGRRQSPINIETRALMYDPRLGPLKFDNNLISGLLYNDGHNIVFNTSAARQLNRAAASEPVAPGQPEVGGQQRPASANSTGRRQAPFPTELVEVVGPLRLAPSSPGEDADNTLANLAAPDPIVASGGGDDSNSIGLTHTEGEAPALELGPWPQVQISGAELAYTFTFEAFYLKFGRDDASGSEHQVNSRAFAGELQLLAYNSDLYKSYTEASTQPHGLLLVAILLTPKPENYTSPLKAAVAASVNEAASAYLEANILARAHLINHKDHYVQLDSLNLSALLPETGQFITYQGSLSKPGCHESAQWFLLNTPLYITRTNLQKLRLISATEQTNEPSGTFIAGNFRPVQPVYNRPLRTNIRPPDINKSPETCQKLWSRYEYMAAKTS